MGLTNIPFVLRDLPESVRIDYSVNNDPEAVGFGAGVLGPDFPPSMAHGFPIMSARVSYMGDGYGAMMGWIQVADVTADGESRLIVDVPSDGTALTASVRRDDSLRMRTSDVALDDDDAFGPHRCRF